MNKNLEISNKSVASKQALSYNRYRTGGSARSRIVPAWWKCNNFCQAGIFLLVYTKQTENSSPVLGEGDHEVMEKFEYIHVDALPTPSPSSRVLPLKQGENFNYIRITI